MQNVVSPGRRAKPKTISLREAASSEKDRRHGAEIIVLNPHKDGDTMASIFRRGDVANQSCSLPLVRVGNRRNLVISRQELTVMRKIDHKVREMRACASSMWLPSGVDFSGGRGGGRPPPHEIPLSEE